MKRQKINLKWSIAGRVSLGVLGLLTIAMLCPMAAGGANAATDCQPGDSACETREARADVGVDVMSTISVGLEPSVNVNVTPKSTGSFASSDATLKVATNNPSGYAVYVKTADASGNLTSTDLGNSSVIAPLTGQMSQADFEALKGNYWGYRIGNGNYNPVPTANTTAQISTESVNVEAGTPDTYTLNFGVAVDTTLPAGQYAGSVVVSAVANPIAVTNLMQLTYMQDMRSDICANTAMNTLTEQGKRLIDTRDGKAYYVAKLADGNCWMTQNLDLDLSTGKTLTNADTDLNGVASWQPTSDTSTRVPNVVANPSQSEALSWDMGLYVLATPQRGVTCNSAPISGVSENNDGYNSLRPGQTFDQCTDFQNVNGWTPDWTAQETADGWAGNKNIGVIAANKETKTYDPHYLIGNYYQWGAATAGSGVKTDAANQNNTGAATDPSKLIDAEDSICPKNWKLPTAGRNTTATAGWPFDREDSFYRLLRAYGYPETGTSFNSTSASADAIATAAQTQWISNNGNAYTSITGPGKTRLDGSPMYFVRSGYIYIPKASLNYASATGAFWSATPTPLTDYNSFYLLFGTPRAYTSDTNIRHDGFSLRCLAR